MRIKFSFLFAISFLAFDLLFSQLHEMVHMSVGKLVCGCWGTQVDFNLWQLCGDCYTKPNAYLATVAGPIFSYAMMYIGVWLLLRSPKPFQQLAAFTLIVDNKAFARLFTAAMGGGDETTALRLLFSDQWHPVLIKVVGFIIVFALAFPPLYIVYKKMVNKYKFWVLLAYCSLPLVFQFFYAFKFLSSLLKSGFLAETNFMGTADLIHIHTALMLLILIISGVIYLKKSKKQIADSSYFVENSG